MFEIEENENAGANIKVVGIGGGGSNAVTTMMKAGMAGVQFVVANTDRQALEASTSSIKIQLGKELTKGLGAGANPEIGKRAAIESYNDIAEKLEGSDMVFVTAGMGGGTGTGGAPVVAKIARELGALTVGVVTRPFMFEGKRRKKHADLGLQELRENVDTLIVIPNQKLLAIAGERTPLLETFKKADEVLLQAVEGIANLINIRGLINLDFADIKTVMANKGMALMGTGVATGENRAVEAATNAISSPLLENVSIDGATGIIINVTGGPDLTMYEVNEASTLITEAAHEDAEIIFGAVIDDNMTDEVRVTVIATGFGRDELNQIQGFSQSHHQKENTHSQGASNFGIQGGSSPSSVSPGSSLYDSTLHAPTMQDLALQGSAPQGDPRSDFSRRENTRSDNMMNNNSNSTLNANTSTMRGGSSYQADEDILSSNKQFNTQGNAEGSARPKRDADYNAGYTAQPFAGNFEQIETLPPLPQIPTQQIEMPSSREQNMQKPVLPRDALLAKVRAFRESQGAQGESRLNRREPVQLSMPVSPLESSQQSTGPTNPDLDSARKLARDMGRQFDEKTYDIPAFIRKNQRSTEPNV